MHPRVICRALSHYVLVAAIISGVLGCSAPRVVSLREQRLAAAIAFHLAAELDGEPTRRLCAFGGEDFVRELEQMCRNRRLPTVQELGSIRARAPSCDWLIFAPFQQDDTADSLRTAVPHRGTIDVAFDRGTQFSQLTDREIQIHRCGNRFCISITEEWLDERGVSVMPWMRSSPSIDFVR